MVEIEDAQRLPDECEELFTFTVKRCFLSYEDQGEVELKDDLSDLTNKEHDQIMDKLWKEIQRCSRY